MANEKTSGKFNPSAGHAYGDPRFGEGSVRLKITEENFDTIMKNLQVGGSIVLKFNKTTTYGNAHYFTEILPPYDKATMTKKASKKSVATTSTSELD